MSAISRSNPQSNPQNTTETAPHPANWPFALEESQYRELETAAVQMAKLIAKIPLEIYKNRAAALVHDFKLSLGESFTDYLMQSENAIRHARFRPDFILTHEGWQCIEVNGGNPGAWRLSCTADSYTSNPKLTEQAHAQSAKP
ncbi:MAG: hypothetical protein HC848_03910 [Limnobacter sp.]|nr:hypothetical protein [Limnobacter sp.]